jgi:hypothetical protein
VVASCAPASTRFAASIHAGLISLPAFEALIANADSVEV